MEISSIAAAVSANANTQLREQVSVAVLKKALDIQEQGALQLLEALPQPAAAPVGSVGGVINTYA